MLNIAVCVSGGGTDLQSIIDACEAENQWRDPSGYF